MKGLAAFLFAGTLLLGLSVQAENWVIQTVDNEGDVGYQTKCWYDGKNNPNILYLAPVQYGTALYHARWTGAGWLKRIIYQSGGGWGINQLSFVQLSPNNVAISYCDYSVYFSTLSDTTWTTTTALSYGTTAFGVALVYDADARPHIFCALNGITGFVHLKLGSNSVWQQVETANFGDQAGYPSINYDAAIDSHNHIYIVYRTTAGNLKIAYYDGTSWGTEYVEDASGGNVGQYCRIIVDQSDVPHIVYYDATNTQLKYATWQTSSSAMRQEQR